ncbi:MAG: hypothetical protein AAFV07_14635, partial [Bacteroidota bacterium]
MKTHALFVACLIALFISDLSAQCDLDYSQWQLIYRDEFDDSDPDSKTVDALLESNWRPNRPYHGCEGQSISMTKEAYFSKDQLSIENGNLVLTATRRDPLDRTVEEYGKIYNNVTYNTGMIWFEPSKELLEKTAYIGGGSLSEWDCDEDGVWADGNTIFQTWSATSNEIQKSNPLFCISFE